MKHFAVNPEKVVNKSGQFSLGCAGSGRKAKPGPAQCKIITCSSSALKNTWLGGKEESASVILLKDAGALPCSHGGEQ